MPEPQRLKVIDAGRPNTLGLTQTALKTIVEKLDAGEKGKPSVKRNFSRWPFIHATIKVVLIQPSGSEVVLKLASRNLSRGGISLLHNCFLHPGSQTVVSLPRLSGGTKDLPGAVKRCAHRRGVLHEIGISFDEEIDLRDFVGVARGTDLFSLERIDADKLVGSVLYVEDNDVDARMFTHFLRETQLRVIRAKTAAEGIELAVQGQDLLVADWRLPDQPGTEMLKLIRELGIETPVLICTSDPLGVMKEGVWDELNTGIISKPLAQQTVLRAIAEQLLVVRDKPEHRPSSAPLSLHTIEMGAKLKPLVESDDLAAVRDACAGLRSAGAAANDGHLQVVAENAMNILDAKGVAKARPLLKELVRITTPKAA